MLKFMFAPKFSFVGVFLYSLFLLVMVQLAVLGGKATLKGWFYQPVPDDVIESLFSEYHLPAVSLGERGPVMSDAYKGEYDFAEHTDKFFTPNVPVWEQALKSFKGKPNLHYLEVGLLEGQSAIWMLENVLTAPTARLTGIDIFSGPLKDRYFANIERSGDAEKVTTLVGFSQVELRKLPLDSFDIIYIDGSHYEDDVLEDAVLSWRLLREEGLLIFDDFRTVVPNRKERPTVGIAAFAECFHERFEVVHNGYQLILRKKPRNAAAQED